MSTKIPIERVRAEWARATSFPGNKEDVYPEHAGAQEFDAAAGKRVLEYGCGGGSDTLSYLRRGAFVTYVDVVSANVEATAKRIKDEHLVAVGYVLDASDALAGAASSSFDIVSAHGVLHHIVDPKPVLAQFRRVLVKGGLLFVMLYTEELEASFKNKIAELVKEDGISESEAFAWCTDGKGAPYARSYTSVEADDLLRGAGFAVQREITFNNGIFRTYKARRK